MIHHRMRSPYWLALAVAVATFGASETSAAEQVPPPLFDGKDKTFRILAASNLRKGDELTSGIIATLWKGGTLKGTGACTQQSCPVDYNGQTVFARRTRVRVADDAVVAPSAGAGGSGGTATAAGSAAATTATGAGGSAGACGAMTSRLQRGDNGDAINRLQTALNASGAALTVDGNFGRGTEAAVMSFQKSKGLDGDGVAGRGTLAALGCKATY